MKRLRKVLKVLAIVLVVLVAVLALYSVWTVRRAWPQVDGEVAAPGLEAPVSAIRDAWGIPHIYAAGEHDLFFTQGYVHAQDRMWQMQFNRMIGAGHFAAAFGPPAIQADRIFRTLGLRRAAERDWEVLDEGTRAILEAYSEGVNAFLDSHRGRLGVEFTVLRIDPEPWTPVDSLTWAKMLSFNLTQNAPREMLRAQLRKTLGDVGDEAARLLLAAYPDDGPITVPSMATAAAGEGAEEAAGEKTEAREARLERPQSPWAPDSAEARAGARVALLGGLDGLVSLFAGGQAGLGSNAWVVHGSRTETGKPILASDTHLGLPMPSIWYENGLHGGRFDVVGFSLAGLPGVIIGHNGHVAWGITAMVTDIQDLFEERLDDAEAPKQYLYMDGWRDLEVIEETVQVKGQAEPTVLEVRLTHHGPLVNDAFEPQLEGQPPMAMAWPGYQGTPLMRAILELDLATDWQSFRQALSYWQAPAMNFVYADVDGNIGYQATGRHPIRAEGHDGTRPAPGWTGENEWQGFIPFEEMPWTFNPEAGIVVTANNKVASDDYPYVLTHDWAGANRARRITDLLAADDSLSLEEMGRIQGDTYSILAENLRPYLLALTPSGDLESGALAEVESWDLRYEPESSGAAIYHVWQWLVLRNTVGDELGEEMMETALLGPLVEHPMTDRLMARPEDPWFDDQSTEEVEGRDEIAAKSLSDAVAWLSERQGDDPAEWNWGELHTMTFAHAPFGQSGIGPLESIFNSKPLPARGGPFTVFATHADPKGPFPVISGTSQRFLADLADLSRSLAVNSTGQSGHAFHDHREDQIQLWHEVELHPVLYSRDSAEADAEGVLTLTPR